MSADAPSPRLRPTDLREALEMVDVIFDTDPSGIFIYSQDGRLVECNRAACEMHGFTKEEMLGMAPKQFIHPDGYQTFVDFQAELERNGFFRGESCGITAEGEKFEVEVFGKPVMINGVGYLYSVIRDITEAKEFLRRLEEHESELEQTVAARTLALARSNQKLQQFAYLTSHDLQEPLRTIRSFSSLLQTEHAAQLDEEAARALTFIEKSAGRMSDMVNDLLEHSRIGGEDTVEDVDLGAMLDDVLADMTATLEASGAQVRVGPMPTLRTHASAARILFQNLISNGIKFAREDAPARVQIEATEAGGGWRFRVADNGIGIDPKHHEKVFQVFKRVHKRDRYEGTGIGLAHCAKVVALHGGEIEIESELGAGATFSFTLRNLP